LLFCMRAECETLIVDSSARKERPGSP